MRHFFLNNISTSAPYFFFRARQLATKSTFLYILLSSALLLNTLNHAPDAYKDTYTSNAVIAIICIFFGFFIFPVVVYALLNKVNPTTYNNWKALIEALRSIGWLYTTITIIVSIILFFRFEILPPFNQLTFLWQLTVIIVSLCTCATFTYRCYNSARNAIQSFKNK